MLLESFLEYSLDDVGDGDKLWSFLPVGEAVGKLWSFLPVGGKLLAQAKATDTTRYSDEGSEISVLEMSEGIKLEI